MLPKHGRRQHDRAYGCQSADKGETLNGDEREGQEDAEDSAQGSARRHSGCLARQADCGRYLVGRASRRQGRPYDDSDE